ncbi:hypothetical protein AMTR_s00121p00068580 [Amborella trichopoda]|uniref:Uncharacterized protein n=1 Tax=Amborella trichopoda TaxID=13333 RepID=W1NPI0_AMBTC|nr:hypothetical protein AMTR_s00121p00068580 [Amborella trichopoda]
MSLLKTSEKGEEEEDETAGEACHSRKRLRLPLGMREKIEEDEDETTIEACHSVKGLKPPLKRREKGER